MEPYGLAADCSRTISHASGTKSGLQTHVVTDFINLILHSNSLSVHPSLLFVGAKRWVDGDTPAPLNLNNNLKGNIHHCAMEKCVSAQNPPTWINSSAGVYECESRQTENTCQRM